MEKPLTLDSLAIRAEAADQRAPDVPAPGPLPAEDRERFCRCGVVIRRGTLCAECAEEWRERRVALERDSWPDEAV